MATDRALAVRAELFGTVFVLVQNLSRRVDLALQPLGLTTRQWLLLAVLTRTFPDRAPSLTEAAAAYGSSRQNVKRIAEQLARRGYLRLVADPADRRPTRLQLTEQAAVFDSPHLLQTQAEFLLDTMTGLDDGQLEQLRDLTRCWLGVLAPDGVRRLPPVVGHADVTGTDRAAG
jgi:DNA-binding MarR family transcriptional regulator